MLSYPFELWNLHHISNVWTLTKPSVWLELHPHMRDNLFLHLGVNDLHILSLSVLLHSEEVSVTLLLIPSHWNPFVKYIYLRVSGFIRQVRCRVLLSLTQNIFIVLRSKQNQPFIVLISVKEHIFKKNL